MTKFKLRKMAITGVMALGIATMVPVFNDVTIPVLISATVQEAGTTAQTEAMHKQASGVNVAYHTQDEIRNYITESGATITDSVTFQTEPVTEAPYSLGKLSDETLKSAIKMLNQIRYIAGLPYDVELDDAYNEKAQAASLVNYVNNMMTHYPEKPSDMSDEIYALGKEGAGSSNLACGGGTSWKLNNFITLCWMEDGDESNIDRVGHRRWLLNPSMKKTGFGFVKGDNGTHCAVYAFDRSGSSGEYGVMWPAQNMPTDYFNSQFPWSISMGSSVDDSTVKVTLKRESDGAIWNFSKTSADGPFYINNGGYGQEGCIIFRPNGVTEYKDGDSYDVNITGLSGEDVSYCVNFFDLAPEEPEPTPEEDSYFIIENGILIKYTGTEENVVIPNSVTKIGDKAFYECENLSNIEIPNSVTEIGERAFYGCRELSNIEIPNSVTKIGVSAFRDCSKLSNIEIPNSVTEIGDYVFWGCSKLSNIEIPNSVTEIGNWAFAGCRELSNIEIPNSVTRIGDYAFYYCNKLSNIEISNSVIKIGNGAFRGCSNLSNIEIPNSVTEIGNEAFRECRELSNIEIPNSVTKIGYYAFYDCNKLSNIEIPNSVTEIGNSTFYGCSNLSDIEIPNSVTEIEYGVFIGCSNLSNIEIPNSVTKIGVSAFSECSKLSNIEIPNSVTEIGHHAFSECSKLSNIEIPNSVTRISSGMFHKCYNLSNIEIPNSVTEIEDNAFYDCSELSNIEIPNSVTIIGASAFERCSKLSNIEILNSVTIIIDDAFKDCSNNLIIYGKKSSYAQQYANEHSIEFREITDKDDNKPEEDNKPEDNKPNDNNENTGDNQDNNDDYYMPDDDIIVDDQETTDNNNDNAGDNQETVDNNNGNTGDNQETVDNNNGNTGDNQETIDNNNSNAGDNQETVDNNNENTGDNQETTDNNNGNTGDNQETVDNNNTTSKDKKILCYITYKLKSGKNNPKNLNFYEQGENVQLQPAHRKGYKFVGWYTDKSCNNKVNSIVIEEDTTLYVEWEEIVVKTPTIKSLKALGDKKLKFSFKKDKTLDGYEIVYSTDMKFKNKQTKLIDNKTTYTLSNLDTGKYAIKVRGYILDSAGKKVYSKYTKTKKINIK